LRRTCDPGGAPGNWLRRTTGAGTGAVRLGSYFHQLRPMDSALSTEQMSKRMRMVSNSTFANETRISPAITSPLSRTRSRISSRFAVPETEGTLCIISQENIDETTLGKGRSPLAPRQRILINPIENCQPLPLLFAGFLKNPEGWGNRRLSIRCMLRLARLAGGKASAPPIPGNAEKLAIYPAGSPVAPVPGSGLPVSAQRRPPTR